MKYNTTIYHDSSLLSHFLRVFSRFLLALSFYYHSLAVSLSFSPFPPSILVLPF